MKTFAYIVTPTNIKQLKEHWGALKLIPDSILALFHKLLPKFKIIKLGKFESVQNDVVKGYKIVCPILDGHKQENLVLERIIFACRIAEGIGVKLIGLGNGAALVADKNYNKIFKSIKTPVTSGNALNAWCIFEKVYRLAKAKNILLNRSTVLILGADTQIGFLAARKLSDYAAKIIITGKDADRLMKLKEAILHQNQIEVVVEFDIETAINGADVVINANVASTLNLKLKENSIYCDIKDMLVKEYRKKGNKFIQPSLGEPVLLLLADKIINYSLGENSNLDKLEEIADIAVQHGYEVWVPEAPVL